MHIYQKTGCAACGIVGKDAELKYVGDNSIAKLTFSIAAEKDENGDTKWLNCVAWRNIAEYCADLGIQKGDSATIHGHIETRTFNDRPYTDLVIEGISVIKKNFRSAAGKPSQNTPPQNALPDDFYVGEDISDEDLPF